MADGVADRAQPMALRIGLPGTAVMVTGAASQPARVCRIRAAGAPLLWLAVGCAVWIAIRALSAIATNYAYRSDRGSLSDHRPSTVVS